MPTFWVIDERPVHVKLDLIFIFMTWEVPPGASRAGELGPLTSVAKQNWPSKPFSVGK